MVNMPKGSITTTAITTSIITKNDNVATVHNTIRRTMLMFRPPHLIIATFNTLLHISSTSFV